jgi:signal transduction histidine kinase
MDRMKTEFITTAAHEFRTPLTSIQGFSELLLCRQLPPAEQKEFLTYIHDKAAVLTEIVNDLLDIARIEAGRGIPLRPSPCTARELVDQILPFIQSRPDRSRFQIDLAAPDTSLRVDRDKIGQVLENLLSNAVKYSPPLTPIRIAGAGTAGEYEITVIDRGIGMTPRQLERIFDKFYRADASNRAVGGVGLGMNIARSIVQAHGGRIWVESAPRQGTRAHFTLPVPP